MANASKIISQLKRFLEKRGFPYSTAPDGNLWGIVNGQSSQWQWIINIAGQDERTVTLRAAVPLKVPAPRRSAVAEYLMRANWGLNVGNFEMNYSDGQVIFRTHIRADSAGVSVGAIMDLVYNPCAMMDRYSPGLLAVALANESPQKAAAAADDDRDSLSQERDFLDFNSAESAQRLDRLFGSEN